MKVSIGQISITNKKAENLLAVHSAARQAANEGAALILFPELAMWYQRGATSASRENAEAIPGPFTNAIDAIAAEFSIAIAIGMYEAAEEVDRSLNTVYVTSASGVEIGRYRKVHLYDAFGLRESDTVIPSGDSDPMVFNLGEFTFGLLTCYDLRFPESARAVVDAGANVILLPALWMPGVRKEDHWATLARARAIENTAYVIASNAAGPLSFGESMFIDPMGIVIAECNETAETRTAELSVSRIEQVRAVNPSVVNRRYRVARI